MFKKLLRRLYLKFTATKFFSYVILHIVPYIRFTTYYTSLRGWKYYRGHKLLQPGDIILTADKKKLTTVLIPGEVAHAALCVDKDAEWEVSEMTHDNYSKSNFFDICKESDRVLILRCKDWDVNYTRQVIEKCKTFENATYDIAFNLGVKALYCSELVYESDFERRLDVSLDDLAGIGQLYISPTGLLQAKNCEIVWDSDEEVRDEVEA